MNQKNFFFRNLEKTVGIFASLALFAIIASALYIAWENDYFASTYELVFTVQKGTGFTKGMPVKLSGFRVGKVNSIALNDQAMVEVKLQIYKKYRKWIREDSEARLVKEGLIGDFIIEITAGSGNARTIEDKGVIRFVKGRGVEELAADMAENVRPILVEVRQLLSYLNNPEGDVRQTVKNIRLLSGNLEATRQNADMLLMTANAEAARVSGKLSATLENADSTVRKLQPLIENSDSSISLVNRKLPVILEKIDSSLTNLEKISILATESAEKNLPLLPGLLQDGGELLKNGNDIMNAAKGVWPIRSYFSGTPEGLMIKGDSRD